jgi:hypothetical protein
MGLTWKTDMPQNTVPDVNWISWMMGCASAVVIFFLAWGLKDVKKRFDRVPELELELERLRSEIQRLQNGKMDK